MTEAAGLLALDRAFDGSASQSGEMRYHLGSPRTGPMGAGAGPERGAAVVPQRMKQISRVFRADKCFEVSSFQLR